MVRGSAFRYWRPASVTSFCPTICRLVGPHDCGALLDRRSPLWEPRLLLGRPLVENCPPNRYDNHCEEQDRDGARDNAAGDLRQLLLGSLVCTCGLRGVSEADGRKDDQYRHRQESEGRQDPGPPWHPLLPLSAEIVQG